MLLPTIHVKVFNYITGKIYDSDYYENVISVTKDYEKDELIVEQEEGYTVYSRQNENNDPGYAISVGVVEKEDEH